MININRAFVDEKNKTALLQRLFFYYIPGAKKRTAWLRRHNILAGMGEHVHWQPRYFPTDPYCLYLHNNIAVAANVTFLGHDIINYVYNGMQSKKIWGHKDCIEIMDNVFIGANSIICPGVRVGPNAIIGAGAVVVKDVPEGAIVGGNPARVIGDFNDLMKRRMNESVSVEGLSKEERINKAWHDFLLERDE